VRLLFELWRLRKRSVGQRAEHEGARTAVDRIVTASEASHAPQAGHIVLSVLSDRHLVQLHNLYQREWWSKDRSLYATRRAVLGSQVVIAMVDEHDELVAFARVLTDYTFKALIFDFIVAGSARNQGLGRKLMDLVTGHEALRTVRHFELYCLPEMVQFYVPHGFSADVGNVQLMRRVRPVA
jgi:GNAT superfamily N-acetyltransferase